MLVLILAAALNFIPVAHVEDVVLTAIFVAQGARAERVTLDVWLEEQDRVRTRAVERRARPVADDPKTSPFVDDPKASPFVDDPKTSPFVDGPKTSPFVDGDDDAKPDPFDGPPKLFWWSTIATKAKRW